VVRTRTGEQEAHLVRGVDEKMWHAPALVMSGTFIRLAGFIQPSAPREQVTHPVRGVDERTWHAPALVMSGTFIRLAGFIQPSAPREHRGRLEGRPNSLYYKELAEKDIITVA